MLSRGKALIMLVAFISYLATHLALVFQLGPEDNSNLAYGLLMIYAVLSVALLCMVLAWVVREASEMISTEYKTKGFFSKAVFLACISGFILYAWVSNSLTWDTVINGVIVGFLLYLPLTVYALSLGLQRHLLE